MRRLPPIIIMVLLLGGAMACIAVAVLFIGRTNAAARPARIPERQAAPAPADNGFRVEAEVLPVTSAELSLAASGVVSKVLVSEGDVVKAGQVLLRLDAARQAATVRETQALLERARFAQAAAQARVSKAQAGLSALKAGATPESVASAQADVALAEADAQVTGAGVMAAAALQRAQAKLDATELRAPFDGTVVTVNAKPGERSPTGSFSVRVADLTQWKIQTKDMTELMVNHVQAGDPVSIKFDAIPGLTLTGKVTHVSDFGASNSTKDIVYATTIGLDKGDPRLRWHMTVWVIFAK